MPIPFQLPFWEPVTNEQDWENWRRLVQWLNNQLVPSQSSGLEILVDGSVIGTEPELEFLSGSGITVSGSDFPGVKVQVSVDAIPPSVPAATFNYASGSVLTSGVSFSAPLSVVTTDATGTITLDGGGVALSLNKVGVYSLSATGSISPNASANNMYVGEMDLAGPGTGPIAITQLTGRSTADSFVDSTGLFGLYMNISGIALVTSPPNTVFLSFSQTSQGAINQSIVANGLTGVQVAYLGKKG